MGTSETHAAVTNGSPPCGGSVAKIFCGSRSTFVDQEMGRLRIVPGLPRTFATTPRQEGQYDVVAMCLPCREQLWFTEGDPWEFSKELFWTFLSRTNYQIFPPGPTDPANHKRSTVFVLGHSSVENPAPNMQRQPSANTRCCLPASRSAHNLEYIQHGLTVPDMLSPGFETIQKSR